MLQGAFESDPGLRDWIKERPDDATVAEFTQFAQQLSGGPPPLLPGAGALHVLELSLLQPSSDLLLLCVLLAA